MKVNSIQNSHLSFTAGKVKVFSDFDGTYFPVWQPDLYDIKSERVNELNADFREFDGFLKRTESDLDFKITTGRTFGEFKNMAELINSKGIVLPYPNSFIAKNGSEEYLKTGNAGAVFPYDYSKTNELRGQNIKSVAGWTNEIKPKLETLLKGFNFEIVEHDSEFSVKDHGKGSLFSSVEYDSFELSDEMEAKSAWKVGLRRDGKFKLHISFPYDMLHVRERKEAYNVLQSEFEKFLNSCGVKYVKEEYIDNVGGNRPTVTYMPKMLDGKALDKLYDTKEALRNALLNNDLVIAAGDGANDYEMLNPLNYIEGSKDLKNPEVVNKLKKLPFIGIVIKGENSGLEGLFQTFGTFGKIIEVEKGCLEHGIKQAIKLYASDNVKFLRDMKRGLKSEILDFSEHHKGGKGAKIFAVLASLTAGVSGVVYSLIRYAQTMAGKNANEVQNES